MYIPNMIESADQKISLSQAQPLIVKVIRVMLHRRRSSRVEHTSLYYSGQI